MIRWGVSKRVAARGCIYVELGALASLDEICEEVYKAFMKFLGRGVRNVVIYVNSSRPSDWVKASACVLSRNLVATVEVYASDTLSRESVLEKCAEVVEVPVAPPTSRISECR
ncbi:MAG: hypothetical protein RMH84_04435 [Sulfolobales archaeon]|nr:hypothetical protein [Sulfolobales archaeon]MDW8010822.1 hypothetical protein [Sulfolobales archaeon]